MNRFEVYVLKQDASVDGASFFIEVTVWLADYHRSGFDNNFFSSQRIKIDTATFVGRRLCCQR
ncbi:hypothetical protein [Salinicoccus halodurans]|uniref:hypothetical protein n=1 Tax=Salinicoccus halodurans TaxID=407035 RepID=UPI00117A59DE|nr:hypothetical protein [Salinicoccus halodurans]